MPNQPIPTRSLDKPIVHTRREFCSCACGAASMLAIGALSACGGSPTGPSTSTPQLSSAAATVSGRVVSVAIDAASPLAAVGSAALVETSLGTFLAARVAQDSFNVMTAICTHEGCTVTGFSSGRFVCPCHGSQYTTSGAVANGPAPRALQQFATSFANNVLTFTA